VRLCVVAYPATWRSASKPGMSFRFKFMDAATARSIKDSIRTVDRRWRIGLGFRLLLG
jgi:hypothetical protein